MKSQLWWYRFPEESELWIKSDCPITEREARIQIRKFHKLKRLPKGARVWPDMK